MRTFDTMIRQSASAEQESVKRTLPRLCRTLSHPWSNKMTANEPRQQSQTVSIEYENADLTPVYVEAAQGMPTPNGALQVSFYSEYMKPLSEVQLESEGKKVRLSQADPFGRDTGKVTITRRIEASLIFTVPALRSIVPWLQQRLDELDQDNSNGAPEQNAG